MYFIDYSTKRNVKRDYQTELKSGFQLGPKPDRGHPASPPCPCSMRYPRYAMPPYFFMSILLSVMQIKCLSSLRNLACGYETATYQPPNSSSSARLTQRAKNSSLNLLIQAFVDGHTERTTNFRPYSFTPLSLGVMPLLTSYLFATKL